MGLKKKRKENRTKYQFPFLVILQKFRFFLNPVFCFVLFFSNSNITYSKFSLQKKILHYHFKELWRLNSIPLNGLCGVLRGALSFATSADSAHSKSVMFAAAVWRLTMDDVEGIVICCYFCIYMYLV